MLQRLLERFRKLGLLGPIALFMVLGPAIGALVLTATSNVWLPAFLVWGGWKVPLFLALTAVFAGFSLMPTHAASLVGGMAFGALGGTLAAMVGTVLAAWLGFRVLRHLCRVRALAVLANWPRLQAVHAALSTGHPLRSIGLLALIRLSPAMPFAATNLLMSTTGIGLVPFLLGSLLGMAPRVVAVAWVGATLSELDWSQASDRRLAIVGILATLLVLWILRGIANRAIAELMAE